MYEQFSAEAAKTGVDKRIEWVRAGAGATKVTQVGDYTFPPFARQPYTQLAKVYKAAGDENNARLVSITSQRDLRRYGRLNLVQRTSNWLVGILTDHGYNPWKPAFFILSIYLLSVFFVWQAQVNNDFIPVGSTAARHHVEASVCTRYYPCLSPVFYPVDAAVPFITLHQVDYWQFDAATGWGQVGRDWTDIATIAGWGLATLLVAALSGLVQKE